VLLEELLKNVSYERIINEKVLQVSGLSADSKHVFDGDLFFCFKGAESDGHDYATDALKQGAVAIICERELPIEACQIIVKDARKSMSEFARAFYGNPAEKMKIIAITGTNGKTTTSHMLASIFNEAGIPCALVGTLGVFYGNKEIEPSLTTPDPIFLHKIFADMVDCGIEIVVMEVSAHAIFYDKIDGIKLQLLHVLEDTKLYEMYKNGDFDTLTSEEYINLLCMCVENLAPDIIIHRLTGDAPKKLLVSPQWSADKKKVLNTITKVFEARNIRQGRIHK